MKTNESGSWFSKNRHDRVAFWFIVVCLLAGVLVTLGKSGYWDRKPDGQWAMKEAGKFVLRSVVGARKVGEANVVRGNEADVYLVEMTVDGLNKFGGPVRDHLQVEMKFSGGSWYGMILSKELSLAQ